VPATGRLKRSLTTPLLVFYGLGNILGAGIYVLIGEVAGIAGYRTPLAFATAAIAVSFTAFSYAELAARFPLSAGEAVYVEEGFGLTWLSRAVGILIALAGMVSAATLANGFVGYLGLFVTAPAPLSLALVLVGLGTLAAWGIRQSVMVASLITLVEILGLLMVLAVAGDNLARLPAVMPELVPQEASDWPLVLSGAFLAFYAFIGFEDMVNVAEEVVAPERTLPRAIVLALVIATLLYAAVALVAVLSVAPDRLAASDAPLALVYEQATGQPAWALGLISLFAVINGVLIQMIMASRIFYGMADRGWLPAALSRVHPRRRTPLNATVLVTLVVLALALALDLVALAALTSTLILVVFLLVNGALLRIRARQPAPAGIRPVAAWVPWLGLGCSAALLTVQSLHLA
jgi:APA family basic amino acid/polyamine antiporter